MRRTTLHPSSAHRAHRGIVLPVALILLVIISFAGLLAARNSASYEQFSNNMRTNQVARQTAEAALRYCERVAIDKAEETKDAAYASDVTKIETTAVISSDANISSGIWNTKSQWASTGGKLIQVTLGTGSNVSTGLAGRYNNKKPSCIIQAMNKDRYLITVRGLSNDAETDSTTGLLKSGSEVWIQSILTPGVPLKSTAGGNQ